MARCAPAGYRQQGSLCQAWGRAPEVLGKAHRARLQDLTPDWFLDLYKTDSTLVRGPPSPAPAARCLLGSALLLRCRLACRVTPAPTPAPPQVPWDTGKEQALVVKAFEAGLFTEPVCPLFLQCQQGQLWPSFSCGVL
jgi:hypothetical protein